MPSLMYVDETGVRRRVISERDARLAMMTPLEHRKQTRRELIIGGGVVVIVIALAATLRTGPSSDPKTAESPAATIKAPTCDADWHYCANDAALANSRNEFYRHANATCKTEVTKKAKYGSPVWPRLAFSSFYTRNDDGAYYINKGMAQLLEKDAQLQNAYGAMVHADVTCEYDLKKQSVIGVYSNHNELLINPGVR